MFGLAGTLAAYASAGAEARAGACAELRDLLRRDAAVSSNVDAARLLREAIDAPKRSHYCRKLIAEEKLEYEERGQRCSGAVERKGRPRGRLCKAPDLYAV